MLKRLLALLFAVTSVTSASAQPSQSAIIEEIRRAYIDLDYDGAERRARAALENLGEFTVDQLADIHSFVGLIAYNRSDFEEARRQFISALQLAPTMELDPLLVPPKILTYFEDLRTELQSGSIESGITRYVLVRDVRPDAAARSMILPGWGQLYKGHRMKAVVLGSTFSLAAGGAVLAHAKRSDARKEYEAATREEDAELLYPRYNRWHKARSAFVQAAGVIWLASYIDALLTDPVDARPAGAMAFSVPFPGRKSATLLLAPTAVSLKVGL